MEYDEFINKNKGIIDTARKRLKKKKWPCFYPKCNKEAIKSHSQPISSSLKSISKDGLIIERDFSSFPSTSQSEWKKIGINRATRFPGFCSKHDDVLFKQVDSLSNNNLNKKALFFLSFRTFALEMRKKEYLAEYFDRILKQQPDLFPVNYDLLVGLNASYKNCLEVTKPYYLKKFEESINLSKIPPMFHYVFKFDKNLGVSCSTTINPILIMEHPLDKPQPMVSFNIMPRKGYTLIVLSSLSQDADLMSSFISNNTRLEDLVFNYCEEVTFNVDFFESINNSILQEIESAQLPWMTWEPVKITKIFGATLDKDSLYKLLE